MRQTGRQCDWRPMRSCSACSLARSVASAVACSAQLVPVTSDRSVGVGPCPSLRIFFLMLPSAMRRQARERAGVSCEPTDTNAAAQLRSTAAGCCCVGPAMLMMPSSSAGVACTPSAAEAAGRVDMVVGRKSAVEMSAGWSVLHRRERSCGDRERLRFSGFLVRSQTKKHAGLHDPAALRPRHSCIA